MTPDQIEKLPYRRNVGVMLVNADGLVFVGQRRDNPEPAWQMPQGGIDKGEAPEAAALRELEEETGVSPELVEIVAETSDWIRYELPVDLITKLWKGRWRGQEQKYFLMRFKGSDSDVNIETEEPEFSAWQWMSPADLPGAIVPFKREVYEKVVAELEPLI
ncbi:MAG: RNA pyrophosphohydrolase [Rhodobacteraceae bacterium]|nr:RNA pyrophosphohydrolase [Paracoccaceae bacterium]